MTKDSYVCYRSEVATTIHRIEILFEESQYEMLAQIAQEESRSLYEGVGKLIDRELRSRQRRQKILAARELHADYSTNPDLNHFSALDSDEFLYTDDEKGV